MDFNREIESAARAGDWERVVAISDRLLEQAWNRAHLKLHASRARALFEVGRRWEAWTHATLIRALCEDADELPADFRKADEEIRRELPEGPLPEAVLEAFAHVAAPAARARTIATALLELGRGLECELRMLRCILAMNARQAPDPEDVEVLTRECPGSLFALDHRRTRSSSAEERLELVEAMIAIDAADELTPIDLLQRRFRRGVDVGSLPRVKLDLLRELGRTEEARAHEREWDRHMLHCEIERARDDLHHEVPEEIEAVFGVAVALADDETLTLAPFEKLVDHVLEFHARSRFDAAQARALHSVISVASARFGEAAWHLHDRLEAGLTDALE